MSQANFESYLAGTEATGFEDDELTIAVSNPLVRETLEQRFRQHILRALYDVVGKPCRVSLTSGGVRGNGAADDYGMFALNEAQNGAGGRGSSRRSGRTAVAAPA